MSLRALFSNSLTDVWKVLEDWLNLTNLAIKNQMGKIVTAELANKIILHGMRKKTRWSHVGKRLSRVGKREREGTQSEYADCNTRQEENNRRKKNWANHTKLKYVSIWWHLYENAFEYWKCNACWMYVSASFRWTNNFKKCLSEA